MKIGLEFICCQTAAPTYTMAKIVELYKVLRSLEIANKNGATAWCYKN